MKNTRKYLKVITTLSLSLFMSSVWLPKFAAADPAVSAISSSVSSDIDILSQLSISEISPLAHPMPADAVIDSVSGDKLKGQQFIPQDGNIYYIRSTSVNPSTSKYATSSDSVVINYYRFINMAPANYPFVRFKSYCWEFKDGILQSKGVIIENTNDASLYKQLTGGLTYVPATDTYPHKRLSTMFDIAGELSSSKFDNIIITTGTTFADSLSGTVLASKLKAPILFVNTPDDSKVYDYINSHLNKSGTVYILGREGAVSTAIENSFTSTGFKVKRIGGVTRYDTSEAINTELNTAEGLPVIVASGEDFPDALSISSVAASKGYPILLTQLDNIPSQTINQLNKIKPSSIYVIGGNGVISENTFNTLKGYCSTIYRISGSDRYETSMNICKTFDYNKSTTITFATGTDFKDALAGSTVAAKYTAPIILINNDASATKSYLTSSAYKNLIIFGDTNSISSATENVLAK